MTVENDVNQNAITLRERNHKGTIVPSLAISLVEAKERMDLLHQFVKEMMVEGRDYGVIGVSKANFVEAWGGKTL